MHGNWNGALSEKDYLELTDLFAGLTSGNPENEINQVLHFKNLTGIWRKGKIFTFYECNDIYAGLLAAVQ